MGYFRVSAAAGVLAALAACDATGFSTQSYPGRTQVAFMSADTVTQRTYACQPSDTQRATQARASRAHRYVDAAILSAARRLSRQGIVGGLAAQAEMNAELSQISRQAEIEYRCALINSRNIKSGLFATG